MEGSLKTIFGKMVNNGEGDWEKQVKKVLFGYFRRPLVGFLIPSNYYTGLNLVFMTQTIRGVCIIRR